jgi:hypothetical protein
MRKFVVETDTQSVLRADPNHSDLVEVDPLQRYQAAAVRFQCRSALEDMLSSMQAVHLCFGSFYQDVKDGVEDYERSLSQLHAAVLQLKQKFDVFTAPGNEVICRQTGIYLATRNQRFEFLYDQIQKARRSFADDIQKYGGDVSSMIEKEWPDQCGSICGIWNGVMNHLDSLVKDGMSKECRGDVSCCENDEDAFDVQSIASGCSWFDVLAQ